MLYEAIFQLLKIANLGSLCGGISVFLWLSTRLSFETRYLKVMKAMMML
jgi:hypothetical protein